MQEKNRKQPRKKNQASPVLEFTPDKVHYDVAPDQSIISRKRGHGVKSTSYKHIEIKGPQIKPQGLRACDYALDENRIKLISQKDGANLYGCIRGYIPGYVEGKVYHKAVVCGKENCKVCGLDYSVVHNRRVNRSFQKIMQFKKVGYLVVTVPAAARPLFLDKAILSKFRNYIRRKLKAGTNTYTAARDVKTHELTKLKFDQKDGKRGLIRYHWCGDDCITWKPHLNILMDSGFWSLSRLEQFRVDVAAWFRNELNIYAPGNIFYAYTSDPLKIKHWLKYVLRPTAKNVVDREIMRTIYGYKNTGYYGTFEKSKTTRDAPTAILAGADPDTGEKIQWEQMVKVSEFNCIYRRFAKEVLIYPLGGGAPLSFGLYVTETIDLIPAGVQLSLNSS